jgi:hypothetical protein
LALRISNDLATGGARSITESLEGDGERRRVDQACVVIVLDAHRRAITRRGEPGGIRNLATPVGLKPAMGDQPRVVFKRLEALLDPSFERRSIGTTREIDLVRNRSRQDQMNVRIHETRKDPSVSNVDRGAAVWLEGSGGFDGGDSSAIASKVDDPTSHAAVPDGQ